MELSKLARSWVRRSALDIPVLVTRTHSAELELEAIIRHHVLLCVRVIGAVHTRGARFGRRRRRRWRGSSSSSSSSSSSGCRLLLLPRTQSWVGRHGRNEAWAGGLLLDASVGSSANSSQQLATAPHIRR